MNGGIMIPTIVIVAVVIGAVLVAAVLLLRPPQPPATTLDAVTALANLGTKVV